MIAEEPEFPQIMSDAEIDANVSVGKSVNRKNQRQPTEKELTEDAVALLQSLFPRIQTFGTFKKIDPWDIGLKP